MPLHSPCYFSLKRPIGVVAVVAVEPPGAVFEVAQLVLVVGGEVEFALILGGLAEFAGDEGLAQFDAAFSVGVFNGVDGVILVIEQVGVVPRAAIQCVGAGAANELIVALPAFEVVVAAVALERVVPAAAVEAVAITAACDFFRSGGAEDDLVVAGRSAVAVNGKLGVNIKLHAVFGTSGVDTAILVGKKGIVQVPEYLFTVILDSFRDPEVIDFLMRPARRVPRPFEIYHCPLEPDQRPFPGEGPGRDMGQLVPADCNTAQIDVARPVDRPVSAGGSSCTKKGIVYLLQSILLDICFRNFFIHKGHGLSSLVSYGYRLTGVF